MKVSLVLRDGENLLVRIRESYQVLTAQDGEEDVRSVVDCLESMPQTARIGYSGYTSPSFR
jgi:hypothetical protein